MIQAKTAPEPTQETNDSKPTSGNPSGNQVYARKAAQAQLSEPAFPLTQVSTDSLSRTTKKTQSYDQSRSMTVTAPGIQQSS